MSLRKKPKTGSLLIAQASLQDPNFGHSVILLCEHEDEGTFGLVLNHDIGLQMSEITDIRDWDADVYCGGPVQRNSLHVLHKCPEFASERCLLGT